MNTKKVRRMAAELLGVGARRIHMDAEQGEALSAAMTKDDVRGLIQNRAIALHRPSHQSRGRARQTKAQRRKGRQGGFGKRKGGRKARENPKARWMKNVRALRNELGPLRKQNPTEVEKAGYRKLYKMIQGNFFRGRKYLRQFVLGTMTGDKK